ncbi:hypothetical protein [Streptomyces sp. Ru72]|uniref:hypothetical protein n=1 Tax=Streptomyces sp. Ru72 TaxID=2080747 RepID=UPI0011B078CC|nr:hypothetical protein [Streptomyces sp. Ru72]
MEMIPVGSEPARSGTAFTEAAHRRLRAGQGGSAPVGDATAWDLFRMAFASVAPPGAVRPPAGGGGCRRP